MNILFLIVILFWWIRIIANLLSYIHLWFIKEYRFDRMIIHLRTKQGKMLYFLPWKRPPLSPKTVSLFLCTLGVLIFFYWILAWNPFMKLLVVDGIEFFLTAVFVFLFKVPTKLYHMLVIYTAGQKLHRHSPLIVIGITGSFAKTSTKEFLYTILHHKYKVLKTDASKNSVIAVAECILKQLRPEHEIFIVEMGAYKRGEIEKIAELVRPQIGIITAINAQHQDLFGSIETTMKAKYELTHSLSGRQIAIFNADNPYVMIMAGWAKAEKKAVWLFSREHQKISLTYDRFFEAHRIETGWQGTKFTLLDRKRSVTVSTRVLGEHQASNITAAIAASVACGMELQEAVNAAGMIEPFHKTMQPLPGFNGSMLINDTFNNNPDAAKAAIKFLSGLKGRKFLVFQPMIELGQYASTAHEEIGRSAALICDEIILTNANFFEAISRGVEQVFPKELHIFSATAAASYLRKTVQEGDVVLFKGKESELVLKKLL